MTPLEHNKFVGMANVGYGIIHVLMVGVMMLVMLPMMRVFANAPRGDAPPMELFGLIMGVAVLINVVLSIPNFVAGYAFLKQKRWAKTAGIVSGVVSAMSIPLGTAVSVYTFWFVFGEQGKIVYEGLQPKLPPPPPSWDQAQPVQMQDSPARGDWR